MPVTLTRQKFSNVILCEDIREEVGNKKSLMGVFSGDIVVPEIPATLQLAAFFTYIPTGDGPETLSFQVKLLQDDSLIFQGSMKATISSKHSSATFVLPRGLVTFEKECVFRVVAVFEDGSEEEIVRKKIIKGEIQPRLTSSPP